MPMRRQLVSLTDRLAKWLDTEVERLGIAPAEVIRRALDEHLDRLEIEEKND